jgi:hypothetical protein
LELNGTDSPFFFLKGIQRNLSNNLSDPDWPVRTARKRRWFRAKLTPPHVWHSPHFHSRLPPFSVSVPPLSSFRLIVYFSPWRAASIRRGEKHDHVLNLLNSSAFFITYNDAGVRFTKTEHNNGKTTQRIVVTFPCPIKIYDSSMAEEILTTTPALKRIGFHTTEVKKEICLNGWNPECIKNTIYGTAVYLSEKKWDLDDDLWSSYFDHSVPIDRETLKNVL